MKIRPITPKDIPALAQFASAMFTHTFGHLYSREDLQHHIDTTCSEAYFISEMAREKVLIDVITQDNAMIAYCKYGAFNLPLRDAIRPCVEIHRLYVEPMHKRGGLGTKMMQHIERYAMHQKAKAIYLGVYSDNVNAQAFYRRLGYERVGEYDYYVGNHIDHEYIFMKPLEAGSSL